MEEKNKQKERLGLKRYISPLTVTGSAFGAGAAYLLSFPVSAAKNLLFEQLPYIADGRVAQRLSDAFEYARHTGGDWAFVGGIAGLAITIYARDWVQSLLGIKKR